jgi:U3 small nucleolar RNA-associated protein 22
LLADGQQSLFKTPTEDYDVVFHLNPSLQTRCSQAVEPDHELWESKLRFRNLADPGVYAGEVRVGFDPTESFARDIQVRFLKSGNGFRLRIQSGCTATR